MIRHTTLLVAGLLALAVILPSAAAADEECTLLPRASCFGLESLEASLSTTQAGAHPNLTFVSDVEQDPLSEPNETGLHDAYAPLRDTRVELPPGLIGDPSVLGAPQLCTAEKMILLECPNGAQVGIVRVFSYEVEGSIKAPLYMMQPPGGDVAARLGFSPGIGAIYIDAKLRSDSDYGLTFEALDAPTIVKVVKLETTVWGVPADPSHNTERCTQKEVIEGCKVSPSRPPGSRPLPFITNPTLCGEPLEMRVGVSSWFEPERFDTKSASFPEITGCDKLPFGPSLTVEPTSARAGASTGADVTIKLPASEGVEVLEPSQMRALKVQLPLGLSFNPGAADGLGTCSEAEVRFGKAVASECPDASKLADTEFDIPALERKLKGAVYLREPEPGNLFRIWIVADDLGLHVKLRGQLEVDKATGQITEVTTEIPQAPVREAKLEFKSGFRAPLLNPPACGEYRTNYEFIPWSGGPPVVGSTPMEIDEGCDVGGFSPKLSAGTTDAGAGRHSPFVFTLTREDGEQNPRAIDITLPSGLAATFAGIPRCEGAAAASGQCPPASRIGRVTVAVGAGATPLWAPQPGKRPTAVYLGGPYKGAPFSVVAVVPAQAGPFDLGDQVVRSALYVDPRTARGSVRSDPLPQIIEGVPLPYRTIQVYLDRPGFTLNPTGCEAKAIAATIASSTGGTASPASPFHAVGCAALGFKPRLSLTLKGAIKRGGHPALRAVVKPRLGDANIDSTVVTLPHSAFLDQAHIRTICTRVQYAAGAGNGSQCPPGAVYGHVLAVSPLLDTPLEGPVILRSSSHKLPDMVFALHGLVDIEAVGRIDSVKGGIRSSFEAIPDAPLSKVVLEMEGGKKGLIVNSRNLCAKLSQAEVRFTGHNGRHSTSESPVKPQCGAKR
jgi:hypothetical protein